MKIEGPTIPEYFKLLEEEYESQTIVFENIPVHGLDSINWVFSEPSKLNMESFCTSSDKPVVELAEGVDVEDINMPIFFKSCIDDERKISLLSNTQFE